MNIPGTAAVLLGALFLTAASISCADDTRSMRIIALGDSTTAGNPAYLSPVEAPPSGRGDEIAERLLPALEGPKPDLLILLAGVNDIYQGRSVEAVKQGLERMYETAASRGVRVMVCTILPYDSASPEKSLRIRQVNDWIRRYAEERGLLFCDTNAAAADPKDTDRLASDTPDGLHPGVDGYRRMAEGITQAIEQVQPSL